MPLNDAIVYGTLVWLTPASEGLRVRALRCDSRRVSHLDGLRGLAALTVVIFHYLSAFVPALTPDETANPHWLSDTPLAVLFNGPFAVVVFFVLSGFVVSKAAHKSDPLPLTIALRYLRLTVPMLASVVIAWLLLTAFPTEATQLASMTGTPWLSKTFNGQIPSFLQAIKDATYDVYRHGGSRFNNVMWSMRWELIGSVAIYSIYAFIHRSSLIVAIFIVFFFLLLWKGPPYYFEAFVFGVLMQEAWTHLQLKRVAPMFALIIGLILGSEGAGFAHRHGLDFLPLVLRPGEEVGINLSDCSRTRCLRLLDVRLGLQIPSVKGMLVLGADIVRPIFNSCSDNLYSCDGRRGPAVADVRDYARGRPTNLYCIERWSRVVDDCSGRCT